MELVQKKIFRIYSHLLYDVADPRTRDKFMSSPLFLVIYILTYVCIVKKLGPKLMKNREPYDIRKYIIIYNVLQILVNLKIMYDSYSLVKTSHNLLCIKSPLTDVMLSSREYFYMLKLADCIETVFFVLRKSYRQISYLHVYHHTGMCLGGWLAYRYSFGQTLIYVSLINCFVHAIMFVYYLLTSIDPEWKNNLTMKKTLTQIQLIQFVIFVCIYTSTSLVSGCDAIPPILAFTWISQNVYMFSLFSDFYRKAYWKKTKDPQTREEFISSPIFCAGYLASYLYIVKKLGPKLMENRNAFDIKKIIIVYNILQILANIRLVYLGFMMIKSSPYLICVESTMPELFLPTRHFFYLLKLADCIETVFFVLRKSYRQISFLHVYHHCGILFGAWSAYRYAFGESAAYVALLNGFVHAVMFVYYLLSSIDPIYKKNLTFKKSLTQIQLIQFVIFIIISNATQLVPGCNGFPQVLNFLWIGQNVYMLYLFGDFYRTTYWKNVKSKRE